MRNGKLQRVVRSHASPLDPTVPYETLELAVDDAVATITLNVPDRLNALSPQLRDELENALAELRPGDRIRVLPATCP